MIPYKQITIDLVPEVMPPEPLLTASQYDNGRPVEVTVQYGGEDYDLTGMTAKIQVRKPSGKVVIADAAQVSGSKVTFNLITQMTAEYGQVLTELSLTGQDQEPIGTANWITYVEKSPASGSPSDTWVQDIDEKVEQAVEAAEAAESSALDAEAWAVGERDGEPVTDQDETYQNNAKYYALSSIAAKEAAEAAASAAVESARSAADSATDASGSAESASGSATASAGSAAQAAGSATAAASSASAASTSAGAAAQSATESAGYATASENSAGVSAGAAEAAGQSATAAARSASTAATYASNASASATASAGSATQAAGSATSAADDADRAEAAERSASSAADAAEDSAAAAEQSASDIAASAAQIQENTDDITALQSAFLSSLITETASGTVLAIDDGADGIDSKSYTLSIEPHQSGNGDPSPDNIRTITGYTSVDVTRAGKNIYDFAALAERTSQITEVDGYYSFFGYTLRNVYPVGQGGTNDIKSDGRRITLSFEGYCVNSVAERDGAAIGFTYSDGTSSAMPIRSYVNLTDAQKAQEYSVTSTAGKTVVGLSFGYYNNDQAYIKNVQIEVGDTSTAYEPYQGITESIPFPSEAGTVYGGTLVKNADGSGTLTVDRGIFTVTAAKASTGEYGWNATYGAWIRNLNYSEGVTNVFYNATDYVKCNAARCVVNNRGISSSQYRTSFMASGWASYEDFQASVAALETAGTPLSYVAPLRTPVTYTIPAEDMAKIPTLKGDNTVWMSADGTIELEYRADTRLYIEKLTSPDDDMIADSNIASGQYFMVGNTLYFADAAITAGQTLIPNTNCTKTNLAAALNAINS